MEKIKQKDPAFLFYPQDFLVGTMTMTFEDRGKYITLLSVMHQQGKLSEETIRFLVGYVSDMLRLKFKQDENGYFYNERLLLEIEKRNKFTESRANNGKLGGRPKKEKTYAKPTYKPNYKPKNNHTEDVNENENKDLLKGGVGEKINFSDLENTQWFETIIRYLKFRINTDKLNEYWNQYQTAMIADDDLYREKNDYRSHFRNWVKIQVDNNEKSKPNKNQQHEPEFDNSRFKIHEA